MSNKLGWRVILKEDIELLRAYATQRSDQRLKKFLAEIDSSFRENDYDRYYEAFVSSGSVELQKALYEWHQNYPKLSQPVSLQAADNQRFLQVAKQQLQLAAVTFEIAGISVDSKSNQNSQYIRCADQNFSWHLLAPSDKRPLSGQITCKRLWVQIAQKPGKEGLQATQEQLNRFVEDTQKLQNQELVNLGLPPLRVTLLDAAKK